MYLPVLKKLKMLKSSQQYLIILDNIGNFLTTSKNFSQCVKISYYIKKYHIYDRFFPATVFLCSEAAPISGFVCPFCVSKKFSGTSWQGWRLRFGMLTVLTNIRSNKLLWKDGHHC